MRYAEACRRAVELFAKAYNSDPWALARLRTQLRNGCESDPEAIIEESQRILAQRRSKIESDWQRWMKQLKEKQ